MEKKPNTKKRARRFGYRLAEKRKELGLSQAELARKCNCHDSLISHYESSSRFPGLMNLINIVEALKRLDVNLNASYLLGFE